jgi:hypothetical protein
VEYSGFIPQGKLEAKTGCSRCGIQKARNDRRPRTDDRSSGTAVGCLRSTCGRNVGARGARPKDILSGEEKQLGAEERKALAFNFRHSGLQEL